MSDNTEWHYVITEDGRVVTMSDAAKGLEALAEAVQQFGTALNALVEQVMDAVREFWEAVIAPFVVAAARTFHEWWRSLPPALRAWARRRVAYAGLRVTGPPRRALFVHRRALA